MSIGTTNHRVFSHERIDNSLHAPREESPYGFDCQPRSYALLLIMRSMMTTIDENMMTTIDENMMTTIDENTPS